MFGGLVAALRWLSLRVGIAAGLLILAVAMLGAFPNTASSPEAILTATPTETLTPLPSLTPTPTATATPEPTATPLPPLVEPPLPDPAILPPLRPDEHWVDVNLTTQTAAAMIGMQRVYLAYGTSGKPGWETPVGTWTILYRVADETMTSGSLAVDSADYYRQEHVLFTQYFTNVGHALHLNYWQPDWVFGRQPTSHGCIGLRYDDAAYFWDFVGVGSKVVVHY